MAPRGHTGHRHVGLVDTEDMVPCPSIRVSSERQASILVTASSFYKGTKDRAPGLVFANLSSHMMSGERYKSCVRQESFFFRLRSTFHRICQ